MVVAHATGEGELPGLRVRQGRQLVVVAADGGKLGLKDFLPPRLLLRAQQVRALADDGGQGGPNTGSGRTMRTGVTKNARKPRI